MPYTLHMYSLDFRSVFPTLAEQTGNHSQVHTDSVESNIPTESEENLYAFCCCYIWSKPLVEESKVDARMKKIE